MKTHSRFEFNRMRNIYICLHVLPQIKTLRIALFAQNTVFGWYFGMLLHVRLKRILIATHDETANVTCNAAGVLCVQFEMILKT